MDLRQRSALVLGGAGGIGKEICMQLIQRGIKKIGVIDVLEENKGRDLFKELPSQDFRFIYKECSVTDEVKLYSCMTWIKNELGGLDIVINSAGILDESNPKKMIEINYGGVVNSTLIGIKLMRKDLQDGNGGFIINIASVSALQGNFCLPIYSGTKHAILGFTRGLNNQAFYEKTGLKFITICPGITRTQMTASDSLVGHHQFPEMSAEIARVGSLYPYQGPECVGKCILAALDDGQNGSVWQCENNRIEKIQLKNFPIF